MSEKVFEELYGELRVCCADAMRMLLMLVLAIFYPFIAEIGFSVMLPLAVITESENEIREMLKWLDWANIHQAISTSDKPMEIKKSLFSARYGNAFFTLYDGRYTLENLQEISSHIRKVERSLERQKMIMIFAIKEVQQKFEDYIEGRVFINGGVRMNEKIKLLREKLIHDMITFCISHMAEIKNESGREAERKGEEFCLFHVVGVLFKAYLNTQHMTCDEIEKYEGEVECEVEKIIADWEEVNDPRIYAEAFCKTLYESSVRITGVFDRTKPLECAVERMEEVIFFDEEYYYLPAGLFHDLCKRIGNVSYIEAQLVRAKVLLDEGKKRRYYTKKIEIVNTNGEIEKRRLVKIAREKIDDPFGLSFEEKLRQEGGESIHGSKIRENDECLRICKNS